MLPSRRILTSTTSPTATQNDNNSNINSTTIQQHILTTASPNQNAANFATSCYNNARTPFAIHEILGLASAATQMPTSAMSTANIGASNLFSTSSCSASRLSQFENNAAAAAAASYFMPISSQSYYQTNFLDPTLAMSLPQSSCQSHLFQHLEMNPTSFITANMSNLDYSNNVGNLEGQSKNYTQKIFF